MKISGERRVGGGHLVLGLLLLGIAVPLHAGEFAYGLGYSVSRSDNITRVPADERGETTHSYLLGFAWLERTTDFSARALAQAEYRDYQDDIFSDEAVYYLSSSMLWTISPQRFTWSLEDAYEQVRIDTTQADTPANRANVNVFSTGPDIYIRFTPINTLALGARAGNVYTGSADVDNDRFSSSARWLYQATSSSTYSLNFQLQDVNYEDSVRNDDFTRHDLFLRADYRPSRSQYVLDAGISQINLDRGNDADGSLVRLSWTRQLTPESSFGMSATGEFSDTGTDILSASNAAAAAASATEPVSTSVSTSLSSDAVTSDVYYAKRGYLFYSRRGTQVALELSGSTQELDYETTAQDRKETGGRAEITFYYSGATTLRLFAEHARVEYQNIVRRDADRDYGIRLGYRLSRSVSLGLEGTRDIRRSTDATDDYEENRAVLSLLYGSSPLYTPVATR